MYTYPKGPFRTKSATTIAKIVNYNAVVFLLRPPYLLRWGPFFETKNVCDSQENGVCTRCTAIANHSAIANSLRVVAQVRRDSKSQCDSKFTTTRSSGVLWVRWPWPRFPQERLATHMVMVLWKFLLRYSGTLQAKRPGRNYLNKAEDCPPKHDCRTARQPPLILSRWVA